MNFRRYLRPQAIELHMKTRRIPEGGLPEDFDPDDPRNLRRIQTDVIEELTEVLSRSGEVANSRRLFRDLHNREKKAVTAIGQGIAIPHVRTLQVKSFIMGFGRSDEGLPFYAPDDEPVRLFFPMAAPPYDDRVYLKVYRALATVLLEPGTVEQLLRAEDPNEILYVLKLVGST